MALISSTTASTATAKQIIAKNSSGGVLYTVPSGKTFTGHIVVGQGNGCQVQINGIDLYTTSGNTPYWLEPIPVTLISGTVVSSGSSYANWALIGTEV